MDVLKGQAEVGRRVAVIGAGGIGFDVSEYLLGEKALETPPEKRLDDVPTFLKVILAWRQRGSDFDDANIILDLVGCSTPFELPEASAVSPPHSASPSIQLKMSSCQ